jgi:hypothetical protein
MPETPVRPWVLGFLGWQGLHALGSGKAELQRVSTQTDHTFACPKYEVICRFTAKLV